MAQDGEGVAGARNDIAELVARGCRGDRPAQASIDIAVDTAVARKDFAEVDLYLRPIADAARSQPSALELLLGLIDNHGIVRATAAKHVRDPELLDEACQDALLSVARNIKQFEGRSRFTTWLYPIAANAGRMATRAAGRRPDDAGSSQLPEIDPSLRRMSSIVVSRDQIRALVDDLPDHYRQPFELREYGGQSYADIAETLGISIGTVKSRIARAREELASRLGH